MGSLPVLKPQEVAALLARLGFQQARQRGSHRPGTLMGVAPWRPFTSGHDISPTLLRKIARDIGVTIEELLQRD